MRQYGPYPEVSTEHEVLARTFSAETITKQVSDLMAKRDSALLELYLTYGLTNTERMVGWSRPTIMMSVRKAEGRL